jgi:uncharacterized protein (DUF488 family)
MKLLTIGFKGRSARDFFGTLKQAGVQKLIDVRRNNVSQLAGYTKGPDLKFFLEDCFGIAYEHITEFAPAKELLKEYRERLGSKKKDDAAWADYVRRFRVEVLSQPIAHRFEEVTKGFGAVCLLCSEETAERCHRRLLSEHFREHLEDIDIRHL